MKKKILIIGGTGFLGYHLAKKSLKKKWEVTSVSINKPKKIRFLKKVNYIYLNIKKKNLIKKKIKLNFDYVVNFGGHVNHKEKNETFHSHYTGCKNLVNHFSNNNKLKLFLQIGSSVEYGKLKSPQSEEARIKINNLSSTYGKAKLLATRLLLKKNKTENFPCLILRPYLIFGPNQDFNRFIPIVIKGCLLDKKFPCSDGEQYRDFLYVDDFINAVFKCLMNNTAKGKIFNIGSTKPLQLRHVIKQIRKITNKGKPQFGKIKMREDETHYLYPDITKLKKKINWSPNVNFNEGLKKTIQFYKKIL